MLQTLAILRPLHRSDPYALTETILQQEVSADLGGRPVGVEEFEAAVARAKSAGWIVATFDPDQNQLWSLTAAGRTEATRRFR